MEGSRVAVRKWVTTQQAKDTLGLGKYDVIDDAWLADVCEAVNAFIARARPDLTDTTDDEAVSLGARMLAARWYTRRNGNEAAVLNEFGTPLPSIDRDIETMLQVGRAARPVVA
jgi:hypothetical protein